MNIDIRTLVIVLGIANVLQCMAVFFQYRLNKAYLGIGWWVLGFTSMALGSFFLLLRHFVAIELITIIPANALILLGPIFIYLGIMRFLLRRFWQGDICPFGGYIERYLLGMAEGRLKFFARHPDPC